MSDSQSLTHLDAEGKATMVDVTDKLVTQRIAVAEGRVTMQPATLDLILEGGHKKGDVFAVSRIAGIQAAKKSSDQIPVCHPLMLSAVHVEFEIINEASQVLIRSTVKLSGKTGVEMEALTAVSVAALTIYDMCKAVDKKMVIGQVHVVEKQGGKSGDWKA